jgi:hypothetical protein
MSFRIKFFQIIKNQTKKEEVIMKAMKLAMVAILIASTVVCMANADGFKPKPKKAYTITLIKARHIPGLVAEMRAQLNPGFLLLEQPVYTQDVIYNGALYRITGTRAQWLLFFGHPKKIKQDIKPEFTTRPS